MRTVGLQAMDRAPLCCEKAPHERRINDTGAMTSHILRRLVESVIVIAVMSFVIYGLIGLMPGDPIDLMLGSDPHLTSADVARLKTAAASLLAAAKRGQADPPPSCVPGLRADYKAAMADFKKGAQGALDGVKAARSGDMQTAASEIQAAAKKIEAATKALDAATTDMETFTASG